MVRRVNFKGVLRRAERELKEMEDGKTARKRSGLKTVYTLLMQIPEIEQALTLRAASASAVERANAIMCCELACRKVPRPEDIYSVGFHALRHFAKKGGGSKDDHAVSLLLIKRLQTLFEGT